MSKKDFLIKIFERRKNYNSFSCYAEKLVFVFLIYRLYKTIINSDDKIQSNYKCISDFDLIMILPKLKIKILYKMIQFISYLNTE